MEIQRACYSRKAVEECRRRIRLTAKTVRIKGQHFSRCFEVKRVFDFCFDKTGCILFWTDNSPWSDYLQLVSRKATKKEMDSALKRCHRFLENEINAIIRMMDDGEVDVVT